MNNCSINTVKFVDLPAQNRDALPTLLAGIEDMIRRGAFVGGPAVDAFEEKIAAYVGVKYAVSCSDGTAALKLALLGAGIKPGDKVVVPTNSYIASANAVVHAGGVPTLVDCCADTYLLDLNQVEDALKAGAKFVLPVHLYGNPCPMDEISRLAERYGATVVEDNAQAIGAELHGRKTGGFGLAAGISFYPAKNLGSFGQGGAIFTNDRRLADLARRYSEQGGGAGDNRYYHEVIGFNERLHSIQAFCLSVMLEQIDSFNAGRRRAASDYLKHLPAERVQRITPDAVPVYHLFEYRCDDSAHRERIIQAFKAKNIGYGFHYPVPIHKQKAYAELNHMCLLVAEKSAETLLSLPMHPFLSEAEVDYVCSALLDA